MITVYLGDVGSYLHLLAKTEDSNAQLLTEYTINDILPGVYYTSLGDLRNSANLSTVLMQASKIVYAPPSAWSDESKGVSQMKQQTEDYLNVFKFRCQVVNQSSPPKFDNILTLVDTRKTQDSQLWIAGCSISHGKGVDSKERYGQLLADRLRKPVSFLTSVGSSIPWAADQIQRSDIKKNDIVVWGLTSYARLYKFEKNYFKPLTPNLSNIDQYTTDFLLGDHVLYQAVTSVCQVINFCQNTQATLIIASVLDDTVVNYIQNFPNLVMLYKLWGRDNNNRFIDFGSDGMHPGVNTHKFYADQIYQRISNLVATT